MEFKPFVDCMAGSLHLPCKSEKEAELAQNEQTSMEMDHVIVVLKQIRDEYEASAARMQQIVEKLDTLEQLSGSTKKVLSETAELLQTSVVDVSPTDFFLQQTKLSFEESKLAKKKLKFQNSIHQLTQRNNNLMQRTEELLRDMEIAKKEYEENKETIEGKAVDTQFTEHQIEKYKKELLKLKEEEKQVVSIDPEKFKQVQERVKTIMEMKTECETLKLKLEKYEGLPPNIEQAKEVLTETMHKYKEEDKRVKAQILNQKERVKSMMSGPSQHPAWRLK